MYTIDGPSTTIQWRVYNTRRQTFTRAFLPRVLRRPHVYKNNNLTNVCIPVYGYVMRGKSDLRSRGEKKKFKTPKRFGRVFAREKGFS